MRARAWVLALASAAALPSPATRSEGAPWVQHRSASDTLCTAEGADPFKYGPPPNPAIPCCKGLTMSSEPIPQGYPGARAGDTSVVCRRIHQHFSAGGSSVQLVEQPTSTAQGMKSIFNTQAEAEAAAPGFNCSGAHKMGNQWMPCSSHGPSAH